MSKLALYNSLSKKKEVFNSLRKNNVSMYVCGITPYDTTHLGHAFLYMQFDVLVRYLQYLGYKVNYVQNVTDVDDDIFKKAKETKQNWKTLGNFWTKRFLTDMELLNIELPTHYVKATDSMPTMIKIIEKLLDKRYAYEKNGNIYFRITRAPEYGKLSKYSEKEMIKLLSERGGDPKDTNKENPLDFILWQKSLPGEPYWQAPFGKGRPGWHIECSAMINGYLGNQIDIHGGGFDLIFPHHESEIAQSESYSGKKPFVGYWMHAGMVYYKGEKMSKSLGNLVMIADLIKEYDANEIRFMLLNHNLTKPWEFKESEMEKARKSFKKLISLPYSEKKPRMGILKNFFEYLDDSLDTSSALKELINLSKDSKNSAEIRAALYILGFKLN